MKAVSAPMFESLRRDLIAYKKRTTSRDEKRAPLPTKLDNEFFKCVSRILTSDYHEYVSVVIRNGRPHFAVEEEVDVWENDCSLNLGGAQRIANPQVRDAVETFLSLFIRHNPFTRFGDTVWGCLYQELLSSFTDDGVPYESMEEEQTYFMDSYLEEINSCMGEVDALNAYLKHLQDVPTTGREGLLSLLSAVSTDDERERKLIDLLLSGVPYVFEKRWDEEDFDSSMPAYSNVTVCEYDFFPLTLCDSSPFQLGSETICVFFDGDSYYTAPKRLNILEADGSFTDVYDREGFATFCFRLKTALNEF